MNISFTAFAICANSGLNLPLRRDEKHVQSWSIAPLRLFYAWINPNTYPPISSCSRYGSTALLGTGARSAVRSPRDRSWSVRITLRIYGHSAGRYVQKGKYMQKIPSQTV